MPLLPIPPQPVPFDEVAAALEAAVLRARGGPMAAVMVSGRALAAALEAEGWRVIWGEQEGQGGQGSL